MLNLRQLAFFLFALGGILLSSNRNTYAYQSGTVAHEGAELKEKPSADSGTIQTLHEGARLNASDRANEGYYLISVASGSGWLKSSDINFAPPAKPATSNATAPREQLNEQKSESRPTTFKIFTGLNFISPTAIDAVLATDPFSPALGIGGEFQLAFSPDWAGLLRLDYINHQAEASSTYDITLSSLQLLVGPDYAFFHSKKWVIHAAALVGLALPSELQWVGTGLSSPNTTIYSQVHACFMGKLEGDWNFSNHWFLSADLGYREAKSSQVTPGTIGSAASNGPLLSGSSPIALSIDTSGPFMDLGIGLNF